jgi:hypothetical protein
MSFPSTYLRLDKHFLFAAGTSLLDQLDRASAQLSKNMRTGRLGGRHASLPATAAAAAAVADVAVWQETTASWPSIGLSATMPLSSCELDARHAALELNAAMPLSSGFLADVFCCDLED